jgi:beta-glucosidase
VRFRVPADATSFVGLDGRRIVEPGAVELRVSRSSADVHRAVSLRLVGDLRQVDHTRDWSVVATVTAPATTTATASSSPPIRAGQ